MLTKGLHTAAVRTIVDGLRVVHRRQAVDDLVQVAGAAWRLVLGACVFQEATALSPRVGWNSSQERVLQRATGGMGNRQLCATAAGTALRDTGFHAGSLRRREG